MKQASEMRKLAIDALKKKKEAEKELAISFAETEVMELIEAAAKNGEREIPLAAPLKVNSDHLREHLISNGYNATNAYNGAMTIYW